MDDEHELPRYALNLVNEIQQVIHDVDKKVSANKLNTITYKVMHTELLNG